MLWPAGDVRGHVAVQLEPPGDAGCHQGLNRPEHGRAADAGAVTPNALEQLLRRDLASDGGERIGYVEPLWRDPLTGGPEPIRGRSGAHGAPTTPAKTLKA